MKSLQRWYAVEHSKKPNRYIWLNRETWWVALTFVTPQRDKSVRKRFSLKTDDIEVAKIRRDRMIKAINQTGVFLDL